MNLILTALGQARMKVIECRPAPIGKNLSMALDRIDEAGRKVEAAQALLFMASKEVPRA